MQTVALGWIASGGIGILGILILICWALGLIDVFKRPDLDRGKRAAWILIIVLLPVIGTIGYFISRPTLPDEADKIIQAQTRGRNY
jgi:hypothetical protein